MTRDEMKELITKIRENQNKLDACPKHHFDLGEPPYELGQKCTCSNCGGSQDLRSVGDYVRG